MDPLSSLLLSIQWDFSGILFNPVVCLCLCLFGWWVSGCGCGIVGFPQVPAPPVRRTPVPTWAFVSSSGRTTHATAPWPPLLAHSATTVSTEVTSKCLMSHVLHRVGTLLSTPYYAGHAPIYTHLPPLISRSQSWLQFWIFPLRCWLLHMCEWECHHWIVCFKAIFKTIENTG